jgi:hypothetical protein
MYMYIGRVKWGLYIGRVKWGLLTGDASKDWLNRISRKYVNLTV